MTHPAEVTALHTALLKTTLEVENSRLYWAWSDGREFLSAERAFEEFVFGDRSLRRLRELLPRLRARFDAFPPSRQVLHRWRSMPPETRSVICHWHVQLTDPLYRRFTSSYLLDRWTRGKSTVSRDQVIRWIEQETGDRWSVSTRIQFASKLLSTAHSAGLLESARDPRPLSFPSVPNEALEYCLHLLRGIEFEGTLLSNPYFASVGLEGRMLEDRLKALPHLTFQRQSTLVDFRWSFPDLQAWAEHTLDAEPLRAQAGGLR